MGALAAHSFMKHDNLEPHVIFNDMEPLEDETCVITSRIAC